MRSRFSWRTFGGSARTVEADHVVFTPNHVVFYEQSIDGWDRVVLAAHESHVVDLTEERL